MNRLTPNLPRPIRRRRGFTLIEAAMVTAIVGIGVVALMQLLAKGTISNRASAELTTAMNLADCVREMTLGVAFSDPTSPTNWGNEEVSVVAYDDLDDFNAKTFSPPRDARRVSLTNAAFATWAQQITVQSVDPDRLTVTAPNGSSRAIKVTVNVTRNNQSVYTASWFAFDSN